MNEENIEIEDLENEENIKLEETEYDIEDSILEDNIDMDEELEEKQNSIITVNNVGYELKYNLKTIKVIEAITKTSLMGEMRKTEGTLPVDFLSIAFSNALFKLDGGKVSQEHGMKIFEAVLKAKGYMYMTMLVVTKIQEDCPFFFHGV